jgi:hypothetical protein
VPWARCWTSPKKNVALKAFLRAMILLLFIIIILIFFSREIRDALEEGVEVSRSENPSGFRATRLSLALL